MAKLRIGFVLDDTLDTPDGVQQYILTLGEWLSSQGHEVHYLVGYTERTDIQHVHSLGRNIKVKFNGNRMSTPLPANAKQLKSLLAQEKFDVLHVQVPYSPFLAQKLILLAPESTAVVGTFHIAPNSGLVTLGNKLLGKLTQKSLRRFDSLFSVSPAAAEFAKNTYGIDSAILPNVVKADFFRDSEPFPQYADVKTIVFLGRLVPRKGCQTLLEAVNLLKTENYTEPFKVVVCGAGALMPNLQNYVQAHDLENIVEFAGFVDNETKARYLKSADIAVFPSSGGESFGIVLLEAMAAQHPVVLGADNAGYKSVLSPYPDVLFPVLDPTSLAVKLRQYLTDEKAAQAVTQWQKTYLPQYDVAQVGRRLILRYEEALRSRRRP
jgi:phosphatidylinositol alpha-mannosyltransferase